MRVLKFGGSSVGEIDCARTVIDLATRRRDEGLVVVLSALAGTTDRLARIGELAAEGRIDDALALIEEVRTHHLRLASGLIPDGTERDEAVAACEDRLATVARMAASCAVLGDLSPPVAARVLGHGERMATRIFASALRAAGVPVVQIDAGEIVVADGNPLAADVAVGATRHRVRAALPSLLATGAVVLTEGFIACTPGGGAVTLGRGGSDWSASLIGAALHAEEIEIWTDVDGIMTADPSLAPEARSIPRMSFAEAAELAAFGARVLHPATLLPAVEQGIPVRVLNTRRPAGAGTLVLAEPCPDGHPVKSIAYKEGLTVVHLTSTRMFKAHGFLRRLFAVLDRHRLAPDVVATSEVSVAFGLADAARLPAAMAELGELGTVAVRTGQAVVCVVGERLKEVPGIVAQVFNDLGDLRASLVSFGGSEINLSFVVDEAALPEVVTRLHRRFFPAVADGVHLGTAAHPHTTRTASPEA